VTSSGTQSNATDGERDAFYHGNLAYNYVKSIDPTYTASDHQVTMCVNSVDDECYSYWDGVQIVFGSGYSQCPNMATLPDIVYHEYIMW
jgi:Zn-dependent metalloprotease